MRSLSTEALAALASPAREFKARVEVYRASTLVGTYSQADAISKIEIERVAQEGKFFGVGVSQKAIITLVNKDRTFEVQKGDKLRISFGIIVGKASSDSDKVAIAGEAVVGKAVVGTGRAGEDVIEYVEYPSFFVEEVVFDDVKQQVSIEAYDIIYKLQSYTVADLGIKAPYTTQDFCLACAQKVGTTCSIDNSLSIEYTKGGNFSGTESLRVGFDAAVESIGCVYYAKDTDVIVVQPLNKEKGLKVDGSVYFSATKSDKYQVGEIASITELGDNTVYKPAREGQRQNIQENAFLTYMDSAQLSKQLEAIYNTVAQISLEQYSMKWRGNLALEPFDEIEIETTRYGTIVSTISNDVITYSGGITENSSWTYVENDNTEANLSTVISKTFARVDKVNNTITLMAGEIGDINTKYSEIELTVDGITSTVNGQNERISKVEQTADSITSTVSAQDEKISKIEQTAESLTTQISNADKKATEAQQTAEGFSQRITDAEGSITFIESSIDGIEASVVNANNNASSAKQTAESFSTQIASAQEDASEALQTANSFSLRISNAEGDISTIESTLDTMSTRISNAEGDASEAVQTANSFSSRITSAEGDISSIEQTLEGVAFKSSLADGTTTINGGCITTGIINASLIKSGTLSADRISGGSIDADNITVKNIKSSNLIGKVPDNCISNANNYITTLRATNIYSAVEYLQSLQFSVDGSGEAPSTGILLNSRGIYQRTNGTSTLITSWSNIGSGGSGDTTATFG